MQNLWIARVVPLVAAVGTLLVVGQQDCWAQRPLYEREPFDRITLNEANESQVLEVLPIKFPGRRIPADPRPNSKIQVELLSEAGSKYEVAWRDIERIDLFEQMLLQRAQLLKKASFQAAALRSIRIQALDRALQQSLRHTAASRSRCAAVRPAV